MVWAGEALGFLRRTIVPAPGDEHPVGGGEGEAGGKKKEPPKVWRVRFDPTRKVLECWVLSPEEVKEVEGGRGDEEEEKREGGRWGFLPGWMGGPEALGAKD